jgi:hypothetical protein
VVHIILIILLHIILLVHFTIEVLSEWVGLLTTMVCLI